MPEARKLSPSVQELLLVGASHRGATTALRERLFLDEGASPALLERLKQEGFAQGLTVVTGDRCELYVFDVDPALAAARLRAILAAMAGVTPELIAAQSFERRGVVALRHLFSVAASLDSPVLGEPQILRQLKANHEAAHAAGLIGPEFEAMLRAAYGAAARVRQETPLAEQPVSMATAAIDVARELFGDLGRCSALMIGIGEMGEMMAAELQKGGLARLTVAHPATARAELMARRLVCHYRDWTELDAALAGSDIVIAALGAGRVAVTRELVKAALKARRHKPMLLFDAALPPDIETAVGELDDAFRYDLDDLERLAMEGRTPRGSAATRSQAAETAARILAEETARFETGRVTKPAAPALKALQAHFEAERLKALTDAGGDAALATRLLADRLLQGPARALDPASHGPEDAAALAELIERLFGLKESKKETK
jgi:glutamyl-tRNA reductase